MAEAMFNRKLQGYDLSDDWCVGSAGTWAGDGLPPMPMAVKAMSLRGIDIGSHTSVPIDDVALESYQLILVMERGHKEAIALEFPEIADRVYLMSEMTGGTTDVVDPVAGALRDHSHAADLIEQVIESGFERIKALAKHEGPSEETK